MDEVRECCDEEVAICLLGNKCDLNEEREVTKEEANLVAGQKGVLYWEVSAKTGVGVKEAFEELFNQISLDFQPMETLITQQK